MAISGLLANVWKITCPLKRARYALSGLSVPWTFLVPRHTKWPTAHGGHQKLVGFAQSMAIVRPVLPCADWLGLDRGTRLKKKKKKKKLNLSPRFDTPRGTLTSAIIQAVKYYI